MVNENLCSEFEGMELTLSSFEWKVHYGHSSEWSYVTLTKTKLHLH